MYEQHYITDLNQEHKPLAMPFASRARTKTYTQVSRNATSPESTIMTRTVRDQGGKDNTIAWHAENSRLLCNAYNVQCSNVSV